MTIPDEKPSEKPRLRRLSPGLVSILLLFVLTLAGTWYVRRMILEKHLEKAVELDDPVMVRSVAGSFPSAAGRAKCGEWGSALNWAVARGQWDLAHFLLDRGAKPGVPFLTSTYERRFWRVVPLDLAVERGRADVVRHLLERGADADGCDGQASPPLCIAAGAGNAEIATLLLDHGAWVRRRDDTGRTPLHRAAWSNRAEMVRLLASRGADVNAQDAVGNTPLHLAAHSGALDAVRALLSLGADATARNSKGNTPLDFARQEPGAAEVVRALEPPKPK